MFLADMVCHLPVVSDVVLGTIYPEKGPHCRDSPAYDTKHCTLPITRPSSLNERFTKTTNTIIDPSFGVVITISHLDSSIRIIYHNTIRNTNTATDRSSLDWARVDGKWRGVVSASRRLAHAENGMSAAWVDGSTKQ